MSVSQDRRRRARSRTQAIYLNFPHHTLNVDYETCDSITLRTSRESEETGQSSWSLWSVVENME